MRWHLNPFLSDKVLNNSGFACPSLLSLNPKDRGEKERKRTFLIDITQCENKQNQKLREVMCKSKSQQAHGFRDA